MRTSLIKNAILMSSVALIVATLTTAVAWTRIAGSSETFTTGGFYVSYHSVEELTRHSDVVVIGTYRGEVGTRTNPVSPHMEAIVQDYEVVVERYLKGEDEGEELIFGQTVAHTSTLTGREDATYAVKDRPGDTLQPGGRYMLFFRATPANTLTPTAQPWQFLIEDGAATVQTPVRHLPDLFPPMAERELVGRVTNAYSEPGSS